MTGLVAKGHEAADRQPLSPGLALHGLGAVALALVLVSSGAFDSRTLPFERRLLMFGVVVALLVPQSSLLFDAARRLLPSPRGPFLPAAIAGALTLALMTVEIHALKATPIVPYAPDPILEFALFLSPFVLPVSGLIASLKWAARPDGGSAQAYRLADAPCALPEAAKIAAWPSEPVLTIQTQDHYLEVRTRGGTRLVRGRMSDALELIPRAQGLQPHRSWWVALSEINGVERRGRDLVLRLTSGQLVPIARGRVKGVRRALGQAVSGASRRSPHLRRRIAPSP